MKIRKDKGIYISKEKDEPYYIGIDSTHIAKCIRQYHRRKCNGVLGHRSFGFSGDNLDFLPDMPKATAIWFWDCHFSSVDGLYALAMLEKCGIMEKRPGINYSRFPKLQELTVHWNSKDSGLSTSSVKSFNLWHYNPRSKMFDGLEIPMKTEYLRIAWFNPSTFDNFPVLPKLTTLQLQMGRNLCDISVIQRIAPNLRNLYIDTCKRLVDPKPILEHNTIEYASLNNRVIVGQQTN